MLIPPERHFLTAVQQFGSVLRGLIAGYEHADVLELGAGRSPAFQREELPPSLASYTLNDISADELARAQTGYKTACFDVSGSIEGFEGQYDVIFSRFLAEHVKDGRSLHRNVFDLLKPGGVAFHLIPTLPASPFVLNNMIPEWISGGLLTKFFPYRESEIPKFPAYYSYCYGDNKKMRRLFSEIGYNELEIKNFYGHPYYNKIPVLREIENAMYGIASRANSSAYSSYAFIIARKAP